MAQRGPAAYYGTIPQIAQARQNNPLQQLATQNLANAASSAPVAQGGWAWADGIARALQSVPGMIQNQRMDKQYGDREAAYMEQLKEAAQLANTPQAQPTAPDPIQAAAAALNTPQQPQPMAPTSGNQVPQPIQSFDPGPSAAAQPPVSPPPMGAGGPSPYSSAQAPMNARAPASAPFPQAPASSRRGSANTQGATPDLDTLFMQGIVAQEGVQNSDGTWQTSFKGAVGPAQVMPDTAREVAQSLGQEFDERRYRNDPEYNLMLGREYFRQQLERFGDPAMAAAAYNAGPGAVSRAVRRARRSGGDWTEYLPSTRDDNGRVVDTTAEYVERFNRSISGSSSQSGPSTRVTDTAYASRTAPDQIAAVGRVETPAPTMEDVPNVDRSSYVPPEVQTNRIAMAQQLLASGNPDMAALAQAYLDQGLSEQNAARTQRNQQQFTFGRDDRQYAENRQQAAQERNYGRETQYDDRSYRASESAADREQRTREANQGVAFQSRENELQRTWQDRRDDRMAEREERLARIRAESSAKDMFWNSATGERIQDRYRVEGEARDDLREKILTFLSLNENTSTGGIRGYTGGLETVWNSDLATMDGLSKQITIEELGGLGIAISDGDRQYVDNSMLNIAAPYEANKNRAEVLMGLIDRADQRATEFLRWRSEHPPQDAYIFEDLWDAYKNEHEIFERDGESVRVRNTPSFREWMENIPYEDGN